jgi:hypothetical protein
VTPITIIYWLISALLAKTPSDQPEYRPELTTLEPPMKNFFRYISYLIFLFAGTLILFSTACNYHERIYPVFKPATPGELIIRGFMISGYSNIYWIYDFKTGKSFPLANEDYTNLLELKYMYSNKNNRDDQKVKHHYEIIRMNLDKYYTNSVTPDLFNIFFEPKIKSLINKDEDNITTPNGQYNITTSRSTKEFIITDTKTTKVLKVPYHHYIFGQTLSPDSQYLAYFENQPIAFNDGSTYTIRILNLKTGKIFSLLNSEISLPGAMIWIRS